MALDLPMQLSLYEERLILSCHSYAGFPRSCVSTHSHRWRTIPWHFYTDYDRRDVLFIRKF